MNVRVPYLSEEAIEADAESLLAEYQLAWHPTSIPPVPVEDILENFLGLSLGFGDLREMLGFDDVLGATWVEGRSVVIDQSLSPEHPGTVEGRYSFTITHEIGHWRLHLPLCWKDPAQMGLFEEQRCQPSIVCRSSLAKERIELQADKYAASLLMPRKMVLEAWRGEFGNLNSHYFSWDGPCFSNRPVFIDNQPVDLENPTHRDIVIVEEFREIARRFALRFGVSVQAMQIRLENVGLLLRERPLDLFSSRTPF